MDRKIYYYQDIAAPSLVYIFTAIPVKILGGMVNTILWEKNKLRKLTLLDFKAYYKITAIKIVWYCQKNKQLDQWERMKSMEIDSHK